MDVVLREGGREGGREGWEGGRDPKEGWEGGMERLVGGWMDTF